jgi:hypothetical protein
MSRAHQGHRVTARAQSVNETRQGQRDAVDLGRVRVGDNAEVTSPAGDGQRADSTRRVEQSLQTASPVVIAAPPQEPLPRRSAPTTIVKAKPRGRAMKSRLRDDCRTASSRRQAMSREYDGREETHDFVAGL